MKYVVKNVAVPKVIVAFEIDAAEAMKLYNQVALLAKQMPDGSDLEVLTCMAGACISAVRNLSTWFDNYDEGSDHETYDNLQQLITDAASQD